MVTKISISLHDSLLNQVEDFMQEHGLTNRSEAVVTLVQKGLFQHWFGKDKEQKVIQDESEK